MSDCRSPRPRGKPGKRGTPVHDLGAGRAETAERRVAELERMRTLLDKLDEIVTDPGYHKAWANGIRYTGPDCRAEIDAARKLVPSE